MMTLFVIAMVAMILAAISTRSVAEATAAVRAEQNLQRKWATASCQRVAIENARDLLTGSPSGEPAPKKSVSCNVALSGLRIELHVDDESSKLNLNLPFRSAGEQKTRELMRKFAPPELAIQLRPLDENLQSVTNDPFESWGQVFSGDNRNDFPMLLMDASSDLSLWSRNVNIRTADHEVIFESARQAAGTIIAGRVVSELKNDPEATIDSLIGSASPTAAQSEALRKLFTEASGSQSLWIVIRDGKSVSRQLTVREYYSDNIHRTHNFTW